MGYLARRRPSAAMVVAIVALVVAASGTAVAATNLTTGDSLIAKRSLSGNRLRNHTVTGQQIKVSSLGTVPSAQHATTADTATSASISRVTYVSSTVPVDTAGLPFSYIGTVSCPAGTIVTGGGASVPSITDGRVDESYPVGNTGWTADFEGLTTGTIYAICAPAAATSP